MDAYTLSEKVAESLASGGVEDVDITDMVPPDVEDGTEEDGPIVFVAEIDGERFVITVQREA